MSQAPWLLDFAVRLERRLVLLAALLLVSIPATAQINKAWRKHDPVRIMGEEHRISGTVSLRMRRQRVPLSRLARASS
jgi:hypothetical protein